MQMALYVGLSAFCEVRDGQSQIVLSQLGERLGSRLCELGAPALRDRIHTRSNAGALQARPNLSGTQLELFRMSPYGVPAALASVPVAQLPARCSSFADGEA